jgi:hypothetical protein
VSKHTVGCAVLAGEGTAMERDYAFHSAVYGEDLEGTDLLDGLQVWLESLSGITEAYDGVSTIYTLLKQSGIDSSEAAVEDWFDAVSAADDPLDLPMNSELRTGPDSAADIEKIGNTFGYPALVEKADVVARAMDLSQFRNSSKGRELNNWVVSEIMDGDLQSLKDVSEHTVDTVQHLGREG